MSGDRFSDSAISAIERGDQLVTWRVWYATGPNGEFGIFGDRDAFVYLARALYELRRERGYEGCELLCSTLVEWLDTTPGEKP